MITLNNIDLKINYSAYFLVRDGMWLLGHCCFHLKDKYPFLHLITYSSIIAITINPYVKTQ